MLQTLDHLCLLQEGDYGRQRVWGAVGWGIFCAVGGAFVQRYGIHAGFWMMLAWLIVAFIPTAFLPLHALQYRHTTHTTHTTPPTPSAAHPAPNPNSPHTPTNTAGSRQNHDLQQQQLESGPSLPQPPTDTAISLQNHASEQQTQVAAGSTENRDATLPHPITPSQWVAAHALPSSPAQRALSGIYHPSHVGANPHSHEERRVHWESGSTGGPAPGSPPPPLESHNISPQGSDASTALLSRRGSLQHTPGSAPEGAPSPTRFQPQPTSPSRMSLTRLSSLQPKSGLAGILSEVQHDKIQAAGQDRARGVVSAHGQNGRQFLHDRQPGSGVLREGIQSFPVASTASVDGSAVEEREEDEEEEGSISLWGLEGSAPLPMAPDLQVRGPTACLASGHPAKVLWHGSWGCLQVMYCKAARFCNRSGVTELLTCRCNAGPAGLLLSDHFHSMDVPGVAHLLVEEPWHAHQCSKTPWQQQMSAARWLHVVKPNRSRSQQSGLVVQPCGVFQLPVNAASCTVTVLKAKQNMSQSASQGGEYF